MEIQKQKQTSKKTAEKGKMENKEVIEVIEPVDEIDDDEEDIDIDEDDEDDLEEIDIKTDDEEEEEEEDDDDTVAAEDEDDENVEEGESNDEENEAEGEEGEGEGVSKQRTTKKGEKKTGKRSGLKVIDGFDKLATETTNQRKQKKTVDEYIENDDYDDDDDDEDDDDDDINYLQKFDSKLRDNFILEHHPEAKTHNYEEVKALSKVSRDGRGIINDPLHKTIPFLTKYEMTRVIGQRAKQLDNGAKAFVKIPLNVIDGSHIAMLELEQKKLPFIIKRPYPNGGVEYWNVNDLEVLL